MSRRLQIAIIGAGIIGTTTAFRLFEEFGDSVEITIFSDRFSPNTTGDISAGLWGPYLLRDTPQHKILKSSRDTHEFLHKLWKNGEAAVAGICLIPIIRVTDDPSEEYDAFWNDVVFGFSRLDKTQSERLNQAQNSNYTSGVQFISFTSEPLKLLPYLYEKLIKFGVHMKRKRIETFNQLVSLDLVVNCSGLGAKELVIDDFELKPIRGQVARIKAPWIFQVMLADCDDGNYIIPNMETVVLGGTHQLDDYNTTINEDDSRFIYDGCVRMNPSIKYSKVVEEVVGLRPGRSSVRLESDTFITKNGKSLPIIHNYGHGGSGVTLSYGCAIEVCQLFRDVYPLMRKL